MFRNYLKISYRNAIKEWQYTLINLFGLAIGIATFVFIVRYLELESNIDQFHNSKERVFKIYSDLKWNAAEAEFPNTPPALGTAMLTDIPEVEEVTRLRQYYHTSVKVGDKVFLETDVRAVDSTFLKVFNYTILEGDSKTLFTKPDEVVLSKEVAYKYFGEESAIGKNLLVNDRLKMVSGVIEDARSDSHFDYSVLLSLSADEGVAYFEWSWLWSNVDTYVMVREGVSKEHLDAKFEKLVLDNAGPSIERITGSSLEDFFKAGNQLRYFAVPLRDVYYDAMNDLGPNGNRTYMKIFGSIAILVILLASINYINLTTARAMRRVREVGIRKVVGSSRRNIILQFILEGFGLTVLASTLAVLIGSFVNQFIQNAFDIRWDLNPLASLETLWLIILTTMITAFLSSLYPAIYISTFRPVDSLKSHSSNRAEGNTLRKALVILQFIASFSMIIIAFSANQQLSFLRSKDLGFDKSQLLVLDHADFLEKQDGFKNRVLQNSFVSNASYTSHVPGKGGNFEVFKKVGAWDQDYMAYLLDADEDFFKTYKIELLDGVGFSMEDVENKNPNVVINQRAVKDFELEQPIGSKIMALDRGGELTVSGIMPEVNFFMSDREPAETVIRPYNDSLAIFPLSYLSIRLNTADMRSAVDQLEELWREQDTGIEFHYYFFDQIFDDNFRNENQMGGMMQLFSGLTIFIALLGLIGLISYNTSQAKKMIGIRKVFGAGIGSILRLVTWDFIKLILIAFVIAIPISNYFIEDWLNQFTYRMELTVYHFLLPGLLIIVLSLLATAVQSIRASNANPIDAIHDE